MFSSLYFQWELNDDSALCCLMFKSICLLRELKGAFGVRELIQKSELRTREDNKIVPACNGEERVSAMEKTAKEYAPKQILSSNCSTLLNYFLILLSCSVIWNCSAGFTWSFWGSASLCIRTVLCLSWALLHTNSNASEVELIFSFSPHNKISYRNMA